MLEVTPLAGPIELRVRPTSAESARDAPELEAAWRAHLREHPRAFDSRIVAFESFDAGVVTGRVATYRRWIGERRGERRAEGTRVRPLAVTGMLRTAGGIVFGRRADDVLQDAGRWELAPSGIVDAGDATGLSVERQLATELGEELGIAWRDIDSFRPVALVHDPASGVVDVACELRTALSRAEVERRFAGRGTREYTELEVVADAHLTAFTRRLGGALAGVSRAILDAAGATAV